MTLLRFFIENPDGISFIMNNVHIYKIIELRLRRDSSPSDTKFITTFCIAQGLPALVSAATAVIDSYGPEDWILPGVGVHRCFLQARQQYSNYFAYPFFIYYLVYILIMIILNMVCFLKLLVFLIRHWMLLRGIESVAPSKVLYRLRLVVRCFFIMGLPMVLLLVANVLEVVNGKKNIMIVQMNMIAMLAGFYMFVSLVCKQTVLKELMKKCCSFGQNGSPGPLMRLLSTTSTSSTSSTSTPSSSCVPDESSCRC